MSLTGNGRENNGAKIGGRRAPLSAWCSWKAHPPAFPLPFDPLTLPLSKIFKPEKSNRFQNFPPKLYNDSFSLGKFNCEFIFLLKRLEK